MSQQSDKIIKERPKTAVPLKSSNILSHDFPSYNRKDLMCLNNIQNQKKLLLNKQSYQFATNDIDGAQVPKKRIYVKPPIHYKDDFLQPKKQYLNKQEFNLLVRDIPGSSPQCQKFKTTRKPTNPLSPQYILPYSQPLKQIEQKFIRNTLEIQDIPGVQPKNKLIQNYNKPLIQKEEIEGSKPSKQFYPKDQIDIMNVKDINEFQKFVSSRKTNPLDPEYTYAFEKGRPSSAYAFSSKPKILHPKLNKPEYYTLATKDIDGAQASTVPYIKFYQQYAQQLDPFNLTTKDIKGAQSSTLKEYIQTTRQLNPVNPVYQNPGHQENKLFEFNFGKDQVFYKPKGKRIYQFPIKKIEEIGFDIISNLPAKFHYKTQEIEDKLKHQRNNQIQLQEGKNNQIIELNNNQKQIEDNSKQNKDLQKIEDIQNNRSSKQKVNSLKAFSSISSIKSHRSNKDEIYKNEKEIQNKIKRPASAQLLKSNNEIENSTQNFYKKGSDLNKKQIKLFSQFEDKFPNVKQQKLTNAEKIQKFIQN